VEFGFLRAYGAERVTSYAPQPPLLDPPEEGQLPEHVNLDVEVDAADWTARTIAVPAGWRASEWEQRPVRFVDGKDVGETIASLWAPGGYPIPVRLSEIGGVAVRVAAGECRREFSLVERVVSMAVDPFPWNEIEEFAGQLQRRGFRLLPAELPDGEASFDFEVMRKSAQNRSNTEMGVLEEAALAQDKTVPTIVDGRLEPRAGGLDQDLSPAVGVIKSHYQTYLHALGLQLLYRLEPGERTPLFTIEQTAELKKVKFPVVSWYVRLVGARGAMPNWGIVRLEVPLRWWRALGAGRFEYVDRVSQLVREYRCRSERYPRAPVSLHPIVRAEELLGALFTPASVLASRFYRLTGL
jgi:hypothetical protein